MDLVFLLCCRQRDTHANMATKNLIALCIVAALVCVTSAAEVIHADNIPG